MKIGFTIVFICILYSGFAQIQNPVQWSYNAIKITDRIGNVYELHITAVIEKGWHIYSQTTGKNGPIPTNIIFTTNPLIKLIDKIKEVGKMEKVMDKNFNTTVKYYSKKVDFVQEIQLKANVKTDISGQIEYMICNDKNCLPPKKVPFTITLQ